MELDIGGVNVYPGSAVSVLWMGVWYDGTVVKLGPKKDLYKVFDPLKEASALLEYQQLKSLDSKLTQSEDKRFAFNDGDDWIQVTVTDTKAVGVAKVSWRKNIHSAETETWFAEDEIATIVPNEGFQQPLEVLQATKSGLIPVKAIESHSRTVQNVVYQSDAESASDSSSHASHEITVHTEPTPLRRKQTTPGHVAKQHLNNNMSASPEFNEDTSFAAYSWNQPPSIQPPSVPPPFFSRVTTMPSKNIAQSSMPCVWSYCARPTNGIAPHHSSLFFNNLRQRQKKHARFGRNSHSGVHFDHRKGRSMNSSPNHKSHSETHTLKRETDGATEEFGRKHSVFDQFVLHKDPRFQETRPSRRSAHRVQGVPPEIVSTSPNSITVKEGDSLLLTCTASGTQPLTYEWQKDNKDVLTQTSRLTFPGPGILELTKVSSQDEGIYSCTASNLHGSASHQFMITVQQVKHVDHRKDLLIEFGAEILPEINFSKDTDVQEYLDALVDEIQIPDDESELQYPQPQNVPLITVAPPTLSDPRARLSNSFDAELDQYLFGYGDDYGQLSSANVLDQRKSKIMEDEGVRDSVEVNTSLGSENSDAQADHHSDPQLPSEEESVLDQVKRFHSSMEEDTPPHNVKQKRWFNRIFSRRK